MNDIINNSAFTLLLTYCLTSAIKQTPIDNRYLPLVSCVLGLLIGVIIGYFVDPTHLMLNIVAGAMGGANATWLDQVVKQIERP